MNRWGRMLTALILTAALCLGAVSAAAQGVLTLPSAVKEIQAEAFAGAQGVDKIVLPDGVLVIGSRAFAGSSVAQINLPAGLTDIAQDAFADCDVLAAVEEGSYAHAWCEANGVRYMFDIDATPEEYFDYVVVNGKARVTGYTGSDVNVVIPPMMGGYPVTELERTFDSNSTLETVVLPSTLELVGGYAFWGCESLTSVTFNSDVTEIGEFAFFQCRALTDFMLPESVTKIGTRAFAGSRKLTKLPFGGHVKTIGASAFEEGWGFTEIEIPDGVQTIGARAFANGQYLKKVIVPESVTSIGANAFASCHRDFALYGVSGSYAQTYAEANGLRFVALDEIVPVEFTYVVNEMGTFVNGYTGTATQIVIPASIDGVKMDGVWNWAFKDNTEITGVTLSEGLTMIGGEAFRGCTALESVTLPESLTTISAAAFRECTALEEIVLPDNATLGWGVFYDCANLNSVTLPANLTAIPAYAFRGCSLLISAPIPAGVTKIDEYAFYACHNLRGVEIPAGVTEIGAYAFDNCEMIEEIVLPETLQTLGGYAFYSCASLTGVEFNSDITEIGEFTFFQCGNLKDIQLPASVTSIGASAFVGCNALTTLPFGEGVVTIGERAFADCYYLAEIEIPETVTTIGARAFSFCYDLTKATIPATVTEIGEMAFWNNDESFTIYGYTGSAAQTFALNNDIPFVSIGAVTPGEPDDPEIEETPATSFSYMIDDGKATILQFIGSETDVVIPAKIEDCPVTSVNSGAFYGAAVESVVFPESVWEIGEYCFSLCERLESVTITAATETIGANIFNECPDVTVYGAENSYAHLYTQRWGVPFVATSHLPALTSSYYLTTDGDEATILFYTGSVADLVIPDNIDGYTITGIGNYAFTDVDGLTKITLPSTLKVIGKHAFSYTALKEIEIPDGVFNIGPGAFRECYSLTKATIPASVTNITSNAFRDCGDNFTIYGYTGSRAESFASEQNYLFVALDGGEEESEFEFSYNDDLTELWVTAYNGTDEIVTVPAEYDGLPVTKVTYNAFRDNTTVKRIILPDSIREIDHHAFAFCENLETINLPEGMTKVGYFVFDGCTNLKNVTLPSTLTVLDDGAFQSCASLTEMTVPEGVTALGDGAFMSCTALEKITLPSTITRIGVSAFSNDAALAQINLPQGLTAIDDYAFYGCAGLTEMQIPDGVTHIGEFVFANCDGLEHVTLPEGLTELERYTFSGCDALVELDIPDSVTVIGEYAVANCDGLTSLTLPANLETIGNYAFYGCGNYYLQAIELPASVKTIGDYAFQFCSGLTSATIYSTDAVFGSSAFANCSGLTISGYAGSTAEAYANENGIPFTALDGGEEPEIPEYTYTIDYNFTARITGYTGTDTELVLPSELGGYPVTTIGAGAFENRTTITKVTLPETLTSIGMGAFAGCTSLGNLMIPDGVTEIGDSAFYNCSAMTEIVIPDGVTTIGGFAFSCCHSLTKAVIPASVTSIGIRAFFETPAAFAIHGYTGSYAQTYAGENGHVFVALDGEPEEPEVPDTTGLVYVIEYNEAKITDYNGSVEGTLYIPSELEGYPVTVIGKGAFSGCKAERIVLPESMRTLYSYSFILCENLKSITIPASVTGIGECAFLGSNSELIVTGTRGSAIEAYAKKYGVGFRDAATGTVIFDNDYGYEIVNGEATIYAYTGTQSELTIPATLEGYPVTEMGDCALKNNENLTSVIIPAGVKKLGVEVLQYCYNLSNVVLPEGLESIGTNSFVEMNALTAITIPASVTTIGSGVFTNAAEGFTIYGYTGSYAQTFAGERGIPFVALDGEEPDAPQYTYTIENGEATITGYSGSAARVLIPETLDGCSVVAIGEAAFADCESLVEIEFPDNVTTIGPSAFTRCTNLTKATIPTSVTAIGLNAFRNCAASFTIYGYAPSYAKTWAAKQSIPFVELGAEQTEGSYTYFVENDKAIITGYTGSEAQLTVPAQLGGYPVSGISISAFENNDNLTAVILPDTVEVIDNRAFFGCSNLEEINLPESIEKLGQKVFASCASLKAIHLPAGLTQISESLFSDSGLESIEIPAGVQKMGNYAFQNCANLTAVTLPEGLKIIALDAFSNCISLKEIQLPDSVTTIETGAFAGCSALETVKLSENLTRLPENCFQNCKALKRIELPVGLTSMDLSVFCRSGLTEIDIPGNVTNVAGETFAECAALQSIAIPPSMVVVPSGFARRCTALTDIDVPEGITTISSEAFINCSALRSATIARSVTSIGTGAFDGAAADFVIFGYEGSYAQTYAQNNGGIPFIVLGGGEEPEEPEDPQGEQTEGDYTYTVENGKATIVAYAGSAEDVVIPASMGGYPVEKIGEYAFEAKTMITVIIPEGVTEIGMGAFYWCESLRAAAIPASVANIADRAFSSCHSDLIITGARDSVAQAHAWSNAIGFADSATGELLFNNDFAYTVDNGVATLTLYTGDDSELVVPAQYDGYTVGALRWGVLQQCDTLTKVTIEARVPEIPRAAFQNCDLLVEVALPDSVTSIATNAFRWCYKLETVHIPASVTSIDATAFVECDADLTFYGEAGSYAQTYAGENDIAFVVMGGSEEPEEPDAPLTENGFTYTVEGGKATITAYTGSEIMVTVPMALGGYPVTAIGARAFEGNTVIDAVVLDEGVTAIGDYAFAGCTALMQVDLPVSLESVGAHAFDGCSALNFVEFEKNVTFVGEDAFASCGEGLFFRAYPGTAPEAYADAHGLWCEYNYDEYYEGGYVYNVMYGGEAAIVGYTGSESDLVIPAQLGGYPVTMIAPEAFAHRLDITSVVFPEGLTLIATNAFAYCTNLTSVSFPSTLIEFYGSAFAETGLTEITLPENMDYIAFYAFEGCQQLEKVTVLSRDVKFDRLVFSNGNSALTIYGYEGSTAQEHAQAQGIPFVALGGSEEPEATPSEPDEPVDPDEPEATPSEPDEPDEPVEPDEPTGEMTENGYTYTVENGEATITDYEGTNTQVTLPTALGGYPVVKIGPEAFAGRTELMTVEIPEGVTEIATTAFAYCTGLSTIRLPASLLEITGCAFAGTAVREMTLPENLERIGAYVFEDCAYLEEVTVLSRNVEIDELAFASCNASLTIYGYEGSTAQAHAGEMGLNFVLMDGESVSGEEFVEGDFTYLIAYDKATIKSYIGTASAYGTVNIPAEVGGYPVTAIAGGAFREAPMGTVVIPDSVTFIGELAFSYCPSLTKLYVPASVTTIEKRVGFRSSSSLTFYGAADSSAQTYAKANAIGFVDTATNKTLFNSDYATTLLGYAWEINAYSGRDSVLTVPASFSENWTSYPVAIIANGVFEDCDSLQEVTIPDCVGRIGARAFADCDNLKRVTVNYNAPRIGEDAFAGCPQDMEIHGYSNTELHAYAVANGFTFVALDAQQYEYTVTNGEAKLTRMYVDEADVVFPAELDGYPVTAIGANVFDFPLNVHSVVMPEGVTTIADNAFDGCMLMNAVEIPSTVRSIGAYAFRNCNDLTSIEIPQEIETIGSSAFTGCSKLARFEIPAGMEEVGAGWFAGCKALAEIVIPDSVESIGSMAFSECESLTGIELPQGLKRIGSGAFEYCYGLVSIELPAAVESIESRAFYACENLPDIVIPGSVVQIGSEAFRACKAFTQVVIPESVKTIGSEAFYGCQNVKEFIIPETVESIGAYALGACPMEMVVVSEAGGYVESYALAYAHAFRVEGTEEILFDYDFGARIEDGNAVINLWEARTYDEESGTLVFPAEMNDYPVTAIEPMAGGKTFRKIILPDSLQSIAKSTFQNCESLTDVTFGSGAVTIGESAFENCHELKNVTWGGAGSVGNYAFRNCYKMSTLELSTHAKTIGQSAFDSCESLYDVALPEGLESIGQSAFMDCVGLEYVTMPDTVTSVGMYAFANCLWLRDVELSDNLTTVSSHMFQGDEQLALVNIPAKAESIGAYAFSGCSQLYRMQLPEGVKTIGSYAFENCGMLTVLILPESLEGIGEYAFTTCVSLTSVTIPQGVLSISGGTFFNCVNLADVYFHDSIWSIKDSAFFGTALTRLVLPKAMRDLGSGAFSRCESLERVVLPEALRTVGSGVFVGCEALESVEFTKGAATVGEYMFYNCTNLKDVEFADTVKEIGRSAFEGCTGLQELALVEGLETIGACAFRNCDAISRLNIPDSVTEIGDEAFAECDNLGTVEVSDGVETLYGCFVDCPVLSIVHIGGNVRTFEVFKDVYGNEKHAFTNSPNVKIFTEYGTEAVEFAIEQGIPYFYLTPVGFNMPKGNLFWSDPFAHSGVIRCSHPITKVIVSLYNMEDTSQPAIQAVHNATGQTDYHYAPLLREKMPFEKLEIGSYLIEFEAYVDTPYGQQWEMLGNSSFNVVELPFRYSSPDGFKPPQLLYITGTEYVPTGTIECNYVIDSVQVRIHKHKQQYPMEGVTLTPGTKSVSAAALHEGIDLSTFETGRYEYGIYAMCKGEERAMYEETFIIANYDGEMSEEDARSIVQFCNKNDAHETFSKFRDYRDILDGISDLDMYMMGITNRNEIVMDLIIDAATSAEKSYVVGLYKTQILDLLDRMDDSTQLIDSSMDISLVKQMKGILGERKALNLDELIEAQEQLKEIYRYELRLKYGDRFSGSLLRKYIDEQCAHADAYLDHMTTQIKRVKAAKTIAGYSTDFIMIFIESAGEYQNMMAILDSLMDAYDGSVPNEFKTALGLVRAEYQERALNIVTKLADMLTEKLAGMVIDTLTDGVFELVGGSAALMYKVANFVVDVGLLVSGEKEQADNNFKFLTKMNLAIESNEAFKRMVDQVQGGDASAETLRRTKITFDAAQMAYESLYELMIEGYSKHANLEEWQRTLYQIQRLSIL